MALGLGATGCSSPGGDCASDGDCSSGEVCNPFGDCVPTSEPITRDFGPVGGDLGQDMGPQTGTEEIMPLAILDQDIILEAQRISQLGDESLRGGPGARVDPSSRSCTTTSNPTPTGSASQDCLIASRDCDGPGSGLPAGDATHTFEVGMDDPESFVQSAATAPTWEPESFSLSPLFESPAGVTLRMSTSGAGNGLRSIAPTRVPTPQSFQITNPDPMDALTLSEEQAFEFSTSGTGEGLYFELADVDRSRFLRCVTTSTTSNYRVDGAALAAYRETIEGLQMPEFTVEIGFREAVTREVPIVGQDPAEVAFVFKWLARFEDVSLSAP